MPSYKKYSLISLSLLFLKGAAVFSSPHWEENAVVPQVAHIPLDHTVIQGVLHAFHTLYPGGESAADGIVQASASSPTLDDLYNQVENRKGDCQSNLSIETMTSFLSSGKDFLDAVLVSLISLNTQVQGSTAQNTFRAALITALLKRNLMPEVPLDEPFVPAEYLMHLAPNMHNSARNFGYLRRRFALELIRHKKACIAQNDTWTTQLRSPGGLEYQSPERTVFEGLHGYFTRLWDAFFTVERLVRNVGLTQYPGDLYYGLLTDACLTHWTKSCPDFAQKFIQTWDTLFIYYTHHLLANAAHPDLAKMPDLLIANHIDLACVQGQPYNTDEATPLIFIQDPPFVAQPQFDEAEVILESTNVCDQDESLEAKNSEDESFQDVPSDEEEMAAESSSDLDESDCENSSENSDY